MFVPHPQPRLTSGLLAALGFTAAVSPVATDMYLSSFRSIQLELGATASAVQWSLTLFFLGLGLGQLVLGPLSDRLGRRTLMLVALSVFALSGLALSITPSIEVLLALRLLQGFSGAAGIVIARAVAADLSEGPNAVRALSLIAMGSALGPLIAPVIGGFTHDWWGWRGTMLTLGLLSTVMLYIAWAKIPESLPAHRRTTGSLWAAFRPFGPLLRNPRYLVSLGAFVFGFAAMIAYVSASPFVGQTLAGMTPLQYALGFSASASALILTNLLNSRLAPRFGTQRMLIVGVTLLLLGASTLMVSAVTGSLTPATLIGGAFVLTAGSGATLANASALALAEAPTARGSGAALLGSVQFLLGGCVAPLVGAWGEFTALPMAFTVFGAASVSAICAVAGVWMRRRA